MPEEPILLAVEARDQATRIFQGIGGALSKLGVQYRTTQKDAEGLTKSSSDISKANPALLGIGVAGLAAAVGVGLIAKSSIDAASDYQAAVTDMAASAGITTDAANKIGDAFLGSAGKTVFSAKQQVEAIAPVSGQLQLVLGHTLTVADANAVMATSMNLAEAAGIDLGSATKDVVNVMQVYGLTTKQAAGASDILYETARLTGQSVDSVTQQVDRLKGRLGPLAPSLLDTATLMADLAKHGVQGRMSMMAATQSMNTLLSGSKSSAEEIKKLGLTVFDASGNFVGMGSVIAQLQPKLKGMTEQQRLAAEKALFGATAGRELDSVIMDGAKGYNQLSKQLGAHDTAQVAAEKRSKDYQHQQAILNATISDMAVMLGTQLIPVIQSVLGWITPIVASIAQWMNQHRQLSAAILIAIGIVGLLTAAVAALSLVMSLNPISLVIIAIAALVVGIIYAYNHVKWFHDAVNAVWGFLKTYFGPVIKQQIGFFKDLWGVLQQAWGKIEEGWTLLQKFGSWLSSTFGPIIKGIGDALGGIGKGVSAVAAAGHALHIPGLQEGGIVSSPTLALIGEAGPEAVVPLRSYGNPAVIGQALGGATNTSNVEDLLEQILAVLTQPVDVRGAEAPLYSLIQKVMRGRQRALVGGI